MNWSDRYYKTLIRDHLLVSASPQPSRMALFMPGWDDKAKVGCLCVERALELGAIDRDTAIVAVERRADLIEGISRRLGSFGFATPPAIIKDELHHVQIADPQRLDLINLDFMGCLTQDVARWLETELAGKLACGATLGVTLTLRCRNNRFMNQMALAWRSQPHWRALARHYATACGLGDQPEVLLHLLVLNCCLSQFKFVSTRPKAYCDQTRHMVAFRFNAITRLPRRDWPTLDEVLGITALPAGQPEPALAQPLPPPVSPSAPPSAPASAPPSAPPSGPSSGRRRDAACVVLKSHYTPAEAQRTKQAVDAAFRAGSISYDKRRGMKMLITKTTLGWVPGRQP